MKLKSNIITMKFQNGHRIALFKKRVDGYKWIGVYQKPKEEKDARANN